MKISIQRLMAIIIVQALVIQTLLVVPQVSVSAAGEPVKVIFDSDFSSDWDDVADLSVLEALTDLGEAEILACMVSSNDRGAALFMNGINNYYGRGNVPSGVRDDATGGVGGYNWLYTQYPSPLYGSNLDAPEKATTLYRKILSQQPDKSVVIVTAGYLNNLENLLKSGPDQFSSLSGVDLVRQKVKLWSCAGGNYPKGNEFNFRVEGDAAQYVVNNWPCKAFFDGYDIGQAIYSGEDLLSFQDTNNPIRAVWEVKNSGAYPTWTQIMIYYAVRTAEHNELYNYVTDGYNWAGEDPALNDGNYGYNEWRTDHDVSGDQEQGYLLEKQRMPIQETLNALVDDSDAPRSRGTRKPPNMPTDIRATIVNNGQIDLKWTDNSWNETGFQIQRYNGTEYTTIGTVDSGVTTYSDTSISSTSNVQYRIAAVNDFGPSKYTYRNVYSGGWNEINLANPGAPIGYNYYQYNNLTWQKGTVPKDHIVVNNDSYHGNKLFISTRLGAKGAYGEAYIYFFYQDKNNWYRLNMGSAGENRPDIRSTRFQKCINGVISDIGTEKAQEIVVGSGSYMLTIQIYVDNGKLTMYYNTPPKGANTSADKIPMTKALEVTDSIPFSGGYVALGGGYGFEPDWGDFNYYVSGDVPPPPTPTPTPSSTPTTSNPPSGVVVRQPKTGELLGTIIGTDEQIYGTNVKENSWDGNTTTYHESTATGAWTGTALSAPSRVGRIRFYPRDGFLERMNGGKFQGANKPDFSDAVTLYTVSSAPPAGWNEVAVTDAGSYQYLRYLTAPGGYINVSEVEFYSYDGTSPSPTPIHSSTPTPLPTPTPSSPPSGVVVRQPKAGELLGSIIGTDTDIYGSNVKEKSWDGDTNTYHESTTSGAWTGTALSAPSRVGKIRFYPRTEFLARMNGGKFQGANNPDFSDAVTLYTVSSAPPAGWNEVTVTDTGSYRYLRYLTAPGGYINVCEVEFYSYDGTSPSPTPVPSATPSLTPTPTSSPVDPGSIPTPVPNNISKVYYVTNFQELKTALETPSYADYGGGNVIGKPYVADVVIILNDIELTDKINFGNSTVQSRKRIVATKDVRLYRSDNFPKNNYLNVISIGQNANFFVGYFDNANDEKYEVGFYRAYPDYKTLFPGKITFDGTASKDDPSARSFFTAIASEHVVMHNVTIKNCMSNDGAAAMIINSATNADFYNTKFLNNISTQKKGGAIEVHDGTCQVTFNDCEFTGNKGIGQYSLGGALCVYGNNTVTLNNTNFYENDAPIGSALAVCGFNAKVDINGGVYDGSGSLYSPIKIMEGGHIVNINGGTFMNSTGSALDVDIQPNQTNEGGIVTINDGNFINIKNYSLQVLNDLSKVIIKGGYFGKGISATTSNSTNPTQLSISGAPLFNGDQAAIIIGKDSIISVPSAWNGGSYYATIGGTGTAGRQYFNGAAVSSVAGKIRILPNLTVDSTGIAIEGTVTPVIPPAPPIPPTPYRVSKINVDANTVATVDIVETGNPTGTLYVTIYDDSKLVAIKALTITSDLYVDGKAELTVNLQIPANADVIKAILLENSTSIKPLINVLNMQLS